MGLFDKKNNKFIKVDKPKIRVERVITHVSTTPPPSRLLSHHGAHAHANLPRQASSQPSSRASSARPSPKPSSAAGTLRQKSHSPYPSSADERKIERKRKVGATSHAARRSPASDHVTFDKDSDAEQEDDSWLKLDDAEVRKRQRKGTLNGGAEGRRPSRQVKNRKAFEQGDLDYIHAVQVASLQHNCVPIMGALDEEVHMELQYPCSKPREKYELVHGREKIDAVEASIRVVQLVAENYFTEEQAEPLTNPQGIIRRLQKTSNKNIQDIHGFKNAIVAYNDFMTSMVQDGIIQDNLAERHDLPRNLVAFILDQVYDRTVAPKVELLSKYENGTDSVYGELLHPFISKMLVDQVHMTADQVFVDLGSGVGNVALQAALEVGCESWGCEMMENACNLAEAQQEEFNARCILWGLQAGKVHLERGDFRRNSRIHKALQRADVVLVNNKAFTPALNDDLVRMFLDLKKGCKVISLKSFVANSKSSHNINDVGSTILDVEEHTYPEGYVSWTNAGGEYYIATRK